MATASHGVAAPLPIEREGARRSPRRPLELGLLLLNVVVWSLAFAAIPAIG